MNTEANTILIVDDDPVNLRALMEILDDDYTVYADRDGKGCIESATRQQPDLILLDVLMADMSGFDVIRALKSDKHTKDIPVIFVTGLVGVNDEVKGFSYGAVDYITKPLNAHVVKMRVQHQIKIVNLIREIKNLSVTDTLTGIGNRRYFNAILEQEWAHAKRQQIPLSFMILDIDDFKRVNDKYGHANGDLALISVVNTIRQVLEREIDRFARWGGEEFTIILPDTPLTGAKNVGESIRKAIEQTGVTLGNAGKVHMTVSIGIQCVIPEHKGNYNIDRLISEADKALHFAKISGKNCVRAFEDFSDSNQTALQDW